MEGLSMKWYAFVFAGVLFASQEPMAVMQSPATAQPPQSSVLGARSTLVLVPALIRTKAGELVFALKADDFVLTDDGIPQKLRLEEDSDGEPLALVVVVESGGAGAREFNKYSTLAPGLAPMLGSIVGNVPHRIAVVTFDSQPTLLQDFTPDTDTAADALARSSVRLHSAASPQQLRGPERHPQPRPGR